MNTNLTLAAKTLKRKFGWPIACKFQLNFSQYGTVRPSFNTLSGLFRCETLSVGMTFLGVGSSLGVLVNIILFAGLDSTLTKEQMLSWG